MCSSRRGSPLVANDDEIPENVGDEEESLERSSTEENASVNDEEAAASAVNPLAQILPMLQNLLLNNDIQRENLTGLIQLYAPSAEETNAMVNAEEVQIAREAELSSQVHLLEQSLQKLEEELENQKKLNAELEEHIKRLTESSDPERQD